MTQNELIEQLDELKSRGRSVLFLGFSVILLLEFPMLLQFFKVQRAGPPLSLDCLSWIINSRHLLRDLGGFPDDPSRPDREVFSEVPNLRETHHMARAPRCP